MKKKRKKEITRRIKDIQLKKNQEKKFILEKSINALYNSWIIMYLNYFRKRETKMGRQREHSLPINETEHYTESIESKKFTKDILVVPISIIKKNLHLKNVNKRIK